jgi:hypothetical protein
MGFRAVVPTSVTWIWCFVSQGCGEDGEGVLRIVFRPVVLTSVTWIVCFVSQGCGEDRGVERDGVDMYGEDGVEMYVEKRDGEGGIWRLRLVFPGSICVL